VAGVVAEIPRGGGVFIHVSFSKVRKGAGKPLEGAVGGLIYRRIHSRRVRISSGQD